MIVDNLQPKDTSNLMGVLSKLYNYVKNEGTITICLFKAVYKSRAFLNHIRLSAFFSYLDTWKSRAMFLISPLKVKRIYGPSLCFVYVLCIVFYYFLISWLFASFSIFSSTMNREDVPTSLPHIV